MSLELIAKVEGAALLAFALTFVGLTRDWRKSKKHFAAEVAEHNQERLDYEQTLKFKAAAIQELQRSIEDYEAGRMAACADIQAHLRTIDNLGRNRNELSKRYDELCTKFDHVDLAKSAAEKEAEILRYDLGVVQAQLSDLQAKPIRNPVKKIRSKRK